MNQTKVIVVGCRQDGHGKVVLEASRDIPTIKIIGFLDDNPSRSEVSGISRLGSSNGWHKYVSDNELCFHVAIGDNLTRRNIAASILNAGGSLQSIIHPRATVYSSTRLGDGCFVGAGAIVGPGASVGMNSIVNHGAIIEHDSRLGDHVNLSSGFVSGGRVDIEEGVFAGVGAKVIPDISVGRWAYLAAGAVVTRNTEPLSLYAGVPARHIRRLDLNLELPTS